MTNIYIKNEKAFTLLELLVVLVIVAAMMTLGIMGIIKLRQVLQVNNAAKALTQNLKQARRYALDNVVTSEGRTPTQYFIEFRGSDYYWGECDDAGCRTDGNSLKAAQYGGVDIRSCGNGNYNFVRFYAVTGEFEITDGDGNKIPGGECTILVDSSSGFINTSRNIDIQVGSRTIQMLL